jgi:hypothetical protein
MGVVVGAILLVVSSFLPEPDDGDESVPSDLSSTDAGSSDAGSSDAGSSDGTAGG